MYIIFVINAYNTVMYYNKQAWPSQYITTKENLYETYPLCPYG